MGPSNICYIHVWSSEDSSSLGNPPAQRKAVYTKLVRALSIYCALLTQQSQLGKQSKFEQLVCSFLGGFWLFWLRFEHREQFVELRCAYMSQKHPDFSVLAARVAVSNLHKNTSNSFVEPMPHAASRK